jgi:Protein of unknown function (DUF2510)
MVADARLSTMSLASDAPSPPRPGPSLAISIGVIVVAAAIGITGLVIGITSVVHHVRHFGDGPQGAIPAHISAQLTPATWQVYVEDDASSDNGDGEFFGPNIDPTLDANDVTVTAADGTSISVENMPGDLTETEDLGNHSYQAAVRFHITSAGRYDVTVRSDGQDDGIRVLVAKSLGSDLTPLLKWFAMAGIGFLLGVAGIAMLIVGIVRRRGVRRRYAYGGLTSPGPGMHGGYYPAGGTTMTGPTQPAPSAPPGMPPPGWFADPHLPGMQRYWDGTRWTDQTRNTT